MAEKNEVLTEDDDKDVEYVVREEPEETEDPRAAEADEDDDDEDEESRMVNADPDDEDREQIRERRRQEKKERKERRERAIVRDKTELSFLRDRNDELERRMMAIESNISKSHLDSVDQRIRQAVNKVEAAEQVIAKAIEAGNGEDVTKAMRFRDQAVNEARQLQQIKATQEQQASQPQQKVDNEVVFHAKEFVKDHPWYDPQGNNEESAVVLAIDTRLAQEGYDPRSSEYWTELRNRVKRRLPEKFEAPARRKAVGGPALGGSSENASGRNNRREVYISPERKAALMEAGVWDDPVLRQRYIKRYMEYDRSNKN